MERGDALKPDLQNLSPPTMLNKAHKTSVTELCITIKLSPRIFFPLLELDIPHLALLRDCGKGPGS